MKARLAEAFSRTRVASGCVLFGAGALLLAILAEVAFAADFLAFQALAPRRTLANATARARMTVHALGAFAFAGTRAAICSDSASIFAFVSSESAQTAAFSALKGLYNQQRHELIKHEKINYQLFYNFEKEVTPRNRKDIFVSSHIFQ